MQRFKTLVAVAAVGILAVAACGDDAEDTGTTTTTTTTSTTEAEQPDEEALAYCERSAELDEAGGPPNEQQIRELNELAPPEIRPDVELFGERFIQEGVNAFGDPEVAEAVDRVEQWEQENCPGAGNEE